jgi:hypothetical protein
MVARAREILLRIGPMSGHRSTSLREGYMAYVWTKAWIYNYMTSIYIQHNNDVRRQLHGLDTKSYKDKRIWYKYFTNSS